MSFYASIDGKFTRKMCYGYGRLIVVAFLLMSTNIYFIWKNAHAGISNEWPSDRKRSNIIYLW